MQLAASSTSSGRHYLAFGGGGYGMGGVEGMDIDAKQNK